MRTMTEDVRRYLGAVEQELSDLGADDRSELLADVEEHLTEVAAEHDGPLEERLGDPAAYASELRSSAGFPPRTLGAERRRAAWRSFVERVISDKRFRSARALVAEVEPGWWMLRGYLLVVLIGDLSRSDFPFPRVNGNQFLGLLAIVLAVWASFGLGRLARRWRPAAVASAIGSGLVAIATIATLADARSSPVIYEESGPAPAGVRHWDGSEALNLCPYGPDGELLSRVFLYDQAGRPITQVPRVPGSVGADVMNAYPRDIRVPSADGVLRDAPCPQLAVLKVGTGSEPSWIEAIVAGTPVFRALLEPGQTRTFYGEEIFLVVGNAGTVNIRANGKSLGKPGATGQVYRGVFDAKTSTLPPGSQTP